MTRARGSSGVALGVLSALVLAAGGALTGLLGALIGLSTGDASAAIAVRGLLPLTFVLLTARVLAAAGTRRRIRRPVAAVLCGALAGYPLDPFSWAARTGITQLVATPGRVTVLGDLLLWLAAALAGAAWGSTEAEPEALPPTPYG